MRLTEAQHPTEHTKSLWNSLHPSRLLSERDAPRGRQESLCRKPLRLRHKTRNVAVSPQMKHLQQRGKTFVRRQESPHQGPDIQAAEQLGAMMAACQVSLALALQT